MEVSSENTVTKLAAGIREITRLYASKKREHQEQMEAAERTIVEAKILLRKAWSTLKTHMDPNERQTVEEIAEFLSIKQATGYSQSKHDVAFVQQPKYSAKSNIVYKICTIGHIKQQAIFRQMFMEKRIPPVYKAGERIVRFFATHIMSVPDSEFTGPQNRVH